MLEAPAVLTSLKRQAEVPLEVRPPEPQVEPVHLEEPPVPQDSVVEVEHLTRAPVTEATEELADSTVPEVVAVVVLSHQVVQAVQEPRGTAW